MARANSINVKPRARCTAENYSFRRKSQQREPLSLPFQIITRNIFRHGIVSVGH